LSFFDETEEPPTTPRRRRPSRSNRRPSSDQQAIVLRRAIAAVVVLIVIVLIALGVHSCQVSQRNSALRSYNNNVSSVMQQSNQTSTTLFNQLTSRGGSGGATTLQNQLNETRVQADNQLSKAHHFSVPDQMKAPQQNVLLALQMRRDGIANIANEIQPALGNSTSKDALSAIATDMAHFYASDVVYTFYAAPLIARALHGAGIAVGANGESIQSSQFLPNLAWLTPTYVATQLHVAVPATSGGKVAPGLHGHSLDSVSVNGTTLQTGSTNTLPASPPPAFTLHITNGGANTETDVTLKVTVSGTSISGQTVVPQTTAGQSTTGQVTLSSSPPAGTYTVTATVEKVPGEKDIANNSLSFPVTFQ
jgi:hypothetical protein